MLFPRDSVAKNGVNCNCSAKKENIYSYFLQLENIKNYFIIIKN